MDAKPTLQSRLLAYGLIAAISGGAVLVLLRVFGPSDDPRRLCTQPDSSPVAEAVAAANGGPVLQRCSPGRTFIVVKGQGIGLDLTSESGVDQGFGWHSLTVSDPSILETVLPPTHTFRNERNGVQGRFFDYVAGYRSIKEGQTLITGL